MSFFRPESARTLLGVALLSAAALTACSDDPNNQTDTGTPDATDTVGGDTQEDAPDAADTTQDVEDVSPDVAPDPDTTDGSDDADEVTPDVPEDTAPDTTPPTVSFTAPDADAVVAGEVAVAAEASDDVAVAAVEFYADGVRFGRDEEAPFEATWATDDLLSGPYTLTAIAFDAAGNEGDATLGVTVDGPCNDGGVCPPTEVTFGAPAPDAVVCGAAQLIADLGGRDDIDRVTISIDGEEIGEVTRDPWTVHWPTGPLENGTYTLRLEAYADGGPGAFTYLTVEVDNTGAGCSDAAPTVAITAPTPATFANGLLAFTADASDDRAIAGVDFSVGDRALFTDSLPPYGFDWNPRTVAEGEHTLRVVARDFGGQTAEDTVQIFVDRTAPMVAVTSPVDARAFTSLIVSADATDTSGVAEVAFYLLTEGTTVTLEDDGEVDTISGTPFTTLTAEPYSTTLDISGLDTGSTYQVAAVATDSAGRQGGAFGTFTLDGPPTVTITAPEDGAFVDGPFDVTVDVEDDSDSVDVVLRGGVDAPSQTLTGTGGVDATTTLSWTPIFTRGEQDVVAEVTDAIGNVTTATISVSVDHPFTIGVEICSPACVPLDNAVDVIGTPTLRAIPRDDDGAVSQVTFHIDGSLATTLTAPPWDYAWDTTVIAEGNHTIRVRAQKIDGAFIETTRTVRVLNCGPTDRDGDGIFDLCDECPDDALNDHDNDTVCGIDERCLGFDDRLDRDSDGIPDGCDECPDDPENDADNDEYCGDIDTCPGFDDRIDNDGDDVPDDCDECLGDPFNDIDGDGVCFLVDLCHDFDDSIDSDSDGTPDGCDVCPNDATNDEDGDGQCEDVDICPGFPNRIDRDRDGIPDACDPCELDPLNDEDNDGSCASEDLCPGFDDRADIDSDGIPNACDDCPNDADNDADFDGVCGDVDICPGFYDTVDSDGDGIPNGCDECPRDAANDVDGDGVCGDVDRCPGSDDRNDADSDGIPDNCDECPNDPLNDDDLDGVCGDVDTCPNYNNNIDSDGDGLPNACDECPYDADNDIDGDGICGDVDDCPTSGTDTDDDGLFDDCDPCPLDEFNDIDGDSVCGNLDICPGEDDTLDTDGDGAPNGCDECPFDPFDDADGDGVCGDVDVCIGFDDTDDADEDGFPDGCDACPNDPLNDDDFDGICGDVDQCPDFPDYNDADLDGLPDACDDCPEDPDNDADGDSVCGNEDLCPGGDDNFDRDGDNIPDDCDECPDSAENDSDADGVCDNLDVCIGFDDAEDEDEDTVPDGCDICPGEDDTIDADGDGDPDCRPRDG